MPRGTDTSTQVPYVKHYDEVQAGSGSASQDVVSVNIVVWPLVISLERI